MNDVEKRFYRLLLVVDLLAILVGMVAGPLRHTSLSIAASVSAGIISLILLGYGLYFWPKR